MFDQIYTTMIFKIALKVALIGYKPELLYNITRKQSIKLERVKNKNATEISNKYI